ncbi:hypothetical protein D3C84_922290 [compost metagenome]
MHRCAPVDQTAHIVGQVIAQLLGLGQAPGAAATEVAQHRRLQCDFGKRLGQLPGRLFKQGAMGRHADSQTLDLHRHALAGQLGHRTHRGITAGYHHLLVGIDIGQVHR